MEKKTADLVENGVDRLKANDSTLAGGISAVASSTDKRLNDLEKTVRYADPGVARVEAELKRLETTNKADLDKLKTKINEQEKVNEAGNKKLDQMLPLIGLIPAIPGRAADAIRPSIPTVPQIENAAATGTCRTLQPGGCSRKAFDDLGNGINENTNQASNNLFDKLNAGANAVQLGLLNVINTKLGDQIVGGISGKLVSGFKWLQLDRALSLLTFAATVQNHLMLSRDIGQTLLGAFSNVLSLIGLKDDSGQAYDIGAIINSNIESFVKAIVGKENYSSISEGWAKAKSNIPSQHKCTKLIPKYL